MNTTIRQTSWYGWNAFALESDALATIIVPEIGAKLVSMLDKRTQAEWLVAPGSRPFQKAAYGADFEKQDMSGWDEMFPTISACSYPGPGDRNGTFLPDHGEVWTLPWRVDLADNTRLVLSVQGQALPYRLTRTLEYSAADTLQFGYQLVNLSDERLAYLWAAHPQFAVGQGAENILPPQVTRVCNSIPAEWGWGEPEAVFDWPEAVSPDGERVRIDRIGPPTSHKARKFFVLPDTRIAWAGVLRQPAGDWLRLQWDPNQIPYFGLWEDEGAVSSESVSAPEPMTGFYDSLALAWFKNRTSQIEPGGTCSWSFSVRFGTPELPFPTGE